MSEDPSMSYRLIITYVCNYFICWIIYYFFLHIYFIVVGKSDARFHTWSKECISLLLKKGMERLAVSGRELCQVLKPYNRIIFQDGHCVRWGDHRAINSRQDLADWYDRLLSGSWPTIACLLNVMIIIGDQERGARDQLHCSTSPAT